MQTILTYHARREPAFLEKMVYDNWRGPITEARNIVVKVGTEGLTLEKECLDMAIISDLFKDMARYTKQGYRFTFVTSGAKAMGKICLGEEKSANLEAGPLCMVGQSKLMETYNSLHANYFGIPAAGQVLVDNNCFSVRRRGFTKASMDGGYYAGCLVIVNANDPSWPYEADAMKTGSDNDVIAKQVYDLLKADLLITLTDVPGFMDGFGTEGQRKIDLVTEVMKRTYELVNDADGKISSGGMASKLQNGKSLIEKGGQSIIAYAKQDGIIAKILSGENYGTWFTGKKNVLHCYL
jgi:glutamate 5-kinase